MKNEFKIKIQFLFFMFAITDVTFSQAQSSNASKLIFQTEKKHEFSSESTQDLFKLILNGKNIFDGTITFQIFNSSGKRIFKEHFTVGELMEFGPVESDKAYKRSKEDSTFIIQVLNEFFDERNFSKPAVKDSAEMKNNYSSYGNWNLIREDNTATGFNYLLGAEDGRSIAYSKKKRRVILYYTCC